MRTGAASHLRTVTFQQADTSPVARAGRFQPEKESKA